MLIVLTIVALAVTGAENARLEALTVLLEAGGLLASAALGVGLFCGCLLAI